MDRPFSWPSMVPCYSYENDLLMINTDIWNTLNEATQKVLREKALEACNWGRDVVEAEHETLIEEFRAKGIQVDVLTEEQVALFKEKVADVKAILDKIRTKYADGRMFELDGISVEYSDWWFNIRASNTEPLLRLIVEAKDKATMEAKRDEILAVIRS